jgi:hypothetical protein
VRRRRGIRGVIPAPRPLLPLPDRPRHANGDLGDAGLANIDALKAGAEHARHDPVV